MYSKPIKTLLGTSLCMVGVLCGCSSNTNTSGPANNTADLSSFRTQVDSFCDTIADTDSFINSIDMTAEGHEATLLTELDALNVSFREFAAVDFPSDYDYLESLADEASSYMDTAVVNFHDIFENEYSETDLESKTEYAKENYNRAYKRIQIIVTFLNGEVSDEVTVTN